jgi:hypothetical protein
VTPGRPVGLLGVRYTPWAVYSWAA